jgi:hypothetical protein
MIKKKFWTIPDRIRDRLIVEDFFESQLPTSEESIVTDNHEVAVTWLQNQEYDGIVTGSDEIWKIKEQEKAGVPSFRSQSRPFPNLYFLDESISGVKFSYAASANQTDLNKLSKKTIETFRQHLAAYDHISVRDQHTKRLVKELGIDEVTKVPDPTLMADIPTPDVESVLTNENIDLNAPILNIHSSIHPVFERICKEYRDRGYQIVTTRSSPYSDVDMYGLVDPFEYYSLYQHFDMVITDSLHSSIFSIKHGTPFATIDTSSVYENIESKTHSLLRDFSMLDRHIDTVNGDVSKFFENQDKLETEPDETHVNDRINELQEYGFGFLDQVKKSL